MKIDTQMQSDKYHPGDIYNSTPECHCYRLCLIYAQEYSVAENIDD
ncbi:MAG: hypothetical protein K9N57_00295 [Candidatus Marinimicrobia bacterium]|nr:hypothetical protein [Candidatus Neomarinimicrobiota bacterium]